MINTVIFDMDGVIVDTEPIHYYAYHQHFKELNIDVPDELYGTFTGYSTINTYQKIVAHFQLPHDPAELVNRKRDLFNDAFDTKPDLELIEGAFDLIKSLHSSGFQLLLASSSAKVTIKRVFDRFALHPYFSYIVSGEDFPQSKPHPAIFLDAVAKSGAPKSACIVIEDSTNGIKAANAAGVFCVGYKSPHSVNQNYNTANLVINHFSELNAEKIRALRF
ncbi:HAD family hydrolase [Flavobacterium sp.]|uniref:HAD family hydrolase n=1 Tax=Flavobacterium sp. TaxID=239 RepID=UPI003B9AACE7